MTRLRVPGPNDWIIDIGGYQGMFLYAAQQAWGSNCIAYDYSIDGINFAKRAFGFTRSKVVNDILTDTFEHKANLLTMVHSFEHMRYPVRLLEHIRDNVLAPDGVVYIEVPNAAAVPLSDPTHLRMFTELTLRETLARGGFSVLMCEHSGFGCENFAFHSSQQNIISVATPAEVSEPSGSLGPTAWRQIEAGQRKLSRALLARSIATRLRIKRS